MTVLSNIITPTNVLTTTNTQTVTNKTLTSPTVAGMTVSDGTANGVTYLNGSKVLTSGSALQFNGSQFGVNTTPSQAIDVVTDGASSIIRSTAYRASDGQAGINLRFARGSVASPTIVLTGDTIGTMEFYPYNGTNFNLQTALISAKVTGTVTTSNIPTALVFGLDAAGAAYSNEQMRLTSTGLGIGTSSPQLKFVVSNGGAQGFEINPNSGIVSGGIDILCYNRSAAAYKPIYTNAEYHVWATSTTERARIDSSGSLLVGTTTDPTTGGLARGIVSIKQLNDTSQTSGLQIEANANTTLIGIGYNGSTFAIGTTYRSTGSYVPISFFTSGSERARITTDGEVLVGTTTVISPNPGISLAPGTGSQIAIGHGNGSLTGTYYAYFVYNGTIIGSITQSGTTAVLYNTTSDQRLKENIQDADSASSLIDSLQVRKFDWKADGSHQRYGFVAQELVTVYPEAVHQPIDTKDMMAVDYSKLVPLLVKEIQSLKARLDAANL